ncbi:MAG: hypothetical protein ACOZAQ_02155 [Pseudomonadota bacterium]
MATNENTQSARKGLPEKEWFTLAEVADRWGCTPDDLLHYGETSRLGICAYFRDVKLAWITVREDWGSWGRDEVDSPFIEEKSEVKWQRGLFRLHAEDIQSFTIGCTSLYPSFIYQETVIGKETKYAHVERSPITDELYVDCLTKSRLLVSSAELGRFEREHGIGQPDMVEAAPTNNPTPPLAWNDITPEQRREHVARRYAELGNYAAVGREIGISGKRVSQLIQNKGTSIKSEAPSLEADLLNLQRPANRVKSET